MKDNETKDSLMQLHSGGDGHILFTNDRTKFRPNMIVAVADLQALIPGILSDLFGEDSYCTMSQFRKPPTARIPPGWAAVQHVSHLTAAWVDIDGRNAPGGELVQWQIEGEISRLVEAGVIPRPSVSGDSGRGVWLFWRIDPVELASRLAVDTLTKINIRAAELLQRLGADKAATSVKSWTRIPGSLNTKAGKEVVWTFAARGMPAKPVVYTLAELAEAFQVSTCPVPSVFTSLPSPIERAPGREKNPARVKGGVNGKLARSKNIVAALVHLASLRGGYRKGTRNMACHYMAVYLHRAGHPLGEIYTLLSSPGMFTPRLRDSEIRKHLNGAPQVKDVPTGGGGFLPIGHQQMANVLRITPDESRSIESGAGVSFPYFHQNRIVPPKPTSAEARQARRDRIEQIATDTPGITERAILDILTSEGLQVSTWTVHTSLVKLGLNRSRRKLTPHEPPPELDF